MEKIKLIEMFQALRTIKGYASELGKNNPDFTHQLIELAEQMDEMFFHLADLIDIHLFDEDLLEI